MRDLFDPYARNARLYPALLTLSPLILASIAAFPELKDEVRAIGGLAVALGAVPLLSALARSPGRRLQAALWAKWGGPPVVLALRHGSKWPNEVTRARYHRLLSEKGPQLEIPTAEAQDRDQKAADQIYTSAVDWLLAHTRDRKRWPLVFSANVDYGFARNLLGLRRVGICFSAAAALGQLGWVGWSMARGAPLLILTVAAGLLSLIGAFVWFFAVGENFVRQTSDAYVRALLESIESLAEAKPKRAPRARKTEDAG
jgi:hypothetical protein